MREIKFRAWDGEKMDRRWKDGRLVIDASTGEAQKIGYGTTPFNISIPHGLTLMQYTGLKDRHGVEIYEGDVIEYRAYMAWHRDVIKFTNGEFHGQLSGLKEEHQSKYSLGLIVSLGAEVIGNIYENPRAIKGEK